MGPPLRHGDGRRLLFLCNNGTYFVAHWAARASVAVQDGFRVAVAVPSHPETAVPWEWVPYPISRRGVGLFENLRAVRRTRRLIAQFRPDVVVSITAKPNLFALLSLRHSPTVGLICNVTGLGYLFIGQGRARRLLRWLVLAAMRGVARQRPVHFVFENADDRQLFVAAGVARLDRAFVLGGAGVDTRRFQALPEPDEVKTLVVLPARMLWDKGVGTFVDAARRLRATGIDARFALLGDTDHGNPSAVSGEQLRAWASEGMVEWWGLVDDMPAALAAAHIVCLPSVREGLPRALLEAAAAGRAVVATDTAGCRDAVIHGETGLLVPVGDANALADALRLLICDVPLRRRMGLAARALAERQFDEHRVLQQSLELYRRVGRASNFPTAAPRTSITSSADGATHR